MTLLFLIAFTALLFILALHGKQRVLSILIGIALAAEIAVLLVALYALFVLSGGFQ